MLSTIARAELFLRAVADSPASLDAARARELASDLLAHRQAVALAYGLPLPPDGSENGGGERGEAARGAEPRPLVLTHPAAIDFGAALADTDHTARCKFRQHFDGSPCSCGKSVIERARALASFDAAAHR